MSEARKQRRAREREEHRMGMPNGVPPGNLPDLGALKHRPQATQQDKHEMARTQLRGQGVICGCGNLIEGEGVELIGYWVGEVPLPYPPAGPGPQPAAAAVTSRCCSRDCAVYKHQREHGLNNNAPLPNGSSFPITAAVVAERDLADVTWLTDSKDSFTGVFDDVTVMLGAG